MMPNEYKKPIYFLTGAVILVLIVLVYDIFQKQFVPKPVIAPTPIRRQITGTEQGSFPSITSPTVIPAKPLGLILSKIEQHIRNVTGSIEYLPARSDGEKSVFLVSLNTHSVDLTGFDFSRDVQIITAGQTTKPLAVTASGDSHHRKGEVTFPKPTIPFTLVLLNIDGIPRSEFVFDR